MLIEEFMHVSRVREKLDPFLTPPQYPKHIALRLSTTGDYRVEFVAEKAVRVPTAFPRSSNIRPNLLCDKINYLVPSFEPPDDAKKPEAKRQKAAEDRRKRWEASGEYHRKWAEGAQHDAARAVVAFFSQDPPGFSVPEEFLTTSVILYFEEDERPICEKSELLQSIRDSIIGEMTIVEHPTHYGGGNQCLVATHTKLRPKGVSSTGQSLIGYNSGVTRCGGFPEKLRMLEAGMTFEDHASYTSGARWVFDHRYVKTVPTKGGNLALYLWCKEAHRMETLAQEVIKGCPKGEDAKAWVESIRDRLDKDESLLDDPMPVHFLSLLSANKIAVRDFRSITVGELARNLIRYLDDFRVPSSKGPMRWAVTPYTILLPTDEKARSPAFTLHVTEQLYAAIFLGKKYPPELLRHAIRKYEEFTLDQSAKYPSFICAATLNAFTQQQIREKMPQSNLPELPEIQDTLTRIQVVEDKLKTNPHFILGQLFAVWEHRADRAKTPGDMNPFLRRFKSFLQNPARILSECKSRSLAHEQKLLARVSKGSNSAKGMSRVLYHRREMDLFNQLNECLGAEEIPRRVRYSDKNWIIRGREHEGQRIKFQSFMRHAKRADDLEEEA